MYNKMIKIHDCLYSATKWQFVILLTTIFFNTFLLAYFLSKHIINGTFEGKHLYLIVTFIVIQYFPLSLPCIYAGLIHAEVSILREMLVSRLYGNMLDKSSRSTARALLGLLETRNLTFSLFHIIDVDLSLPFKLLGLIFTYLIIILQFDKVIMP